MKTYLGGCHCGAVRYEVDAAELIEAVECNCSICGRTGYLHLIVPKSRFRLLAGADRLHAYTFNTGVARHLFCVECGIKSFYVPRSNPDGYSVNVRCLDGYPDLPLNISPFDGRNWEHEDRRLSGLSKA
jgi:hypothetical protein